jgi:hypothetical protein
MVRRLALALLLALPLSGLAPVGAQAHAPAREPSQISYIAWDTSAELATGKARGTTTLGDQIVLATPAPDRRSMAGKSFETGRWRSPWVADTFAFTELVASWDATTTKRSFVEVEVRGRGAQGRSSWDTLARWAARRGAGT